MQGMISGSSNFGRLAMSTEALQSIYHAKVQLLLILIETLDLENLLQMIHDEMPFRCQQLIIFFLVCLPLKLFVFHLFFGKYVEL